MAYIFLLCITLIEAAPLTAYAHETYEDNGKDYSAGSSFFEASDSPLPAASENSIVINPKKHDFGSVSLQYKGITTYIKGVPDSFSKDNLENLALNIDKALLAKSIYKLVNRALIDAEKYSTEPPKTFDQGYDSLLCWASGATNMLWMSGYAQQATNPLTNARFKNEDDVFNYFRKCFADYGGEPDGALEYFFKGTYKYAGNRTTAQLREDAPKGELLKNAYSKANIRKIEPDNKKNIFESLKSLDSLSCAAIIRYYSTKTKLPDGGAHAITICGIVIDKNSTDPLKRYKGIIISDSDNDAVIQKGYGKDPADVKAKKAAQAPNSYTFYPLLWEVINKEGQWVIGKYHEGTAYKATIESLTIMNDSPTGSSHDIDPSSGGIDINKASVSCKKSYVYTGKNIKPIKVYYGKTKLREGVDYTITYKRNKNAGQAIALIKGIGKNKGSKTIRFSITKAPNTLSIKPLIKKYAAKSLTKPISFTIKATQGQGRLSCALGSKAKKAHIRIASQGKVIIPKHCKKGVYRIAVKAKGNANYKAALRVITIYVK